jgi:hypothetical protein
MLEAARAWLVVDLRRSYPGSQKRKARISFNGLAKKEVAEKRPRKKMIRRHRPRPNESLI